MKILLVNQSFYPDVVSTAQHTSDMACALAERGHDVTVIASNRGYDDPSVRFPRQESWKGIRILRVPCLATGKGKRWKRAVNISSFFITCSWRLLLMQRFDVAIALTSPPLISALGALFVRLRGGRFVFWVMDLNPDEAIAAGWLREGSRTARVLESVLRFSAHSADRIIVLDRFMRDRIAAKGLPATKIVTLPPWSHDREVQFDAEGRRAFRERHGLTGKYVVMYSGNHSPCHPLDTVLEAAVQLANEPDVAFCFVGGGSEHGKVRAFAERHNLRNFVCLPYQPLSSLSASLSAADLHLVVMGQPLAGMVHPCKIYNVMAIGIPVLYVGPEASHVSDIADENPELPIARVEHGDVAGVVARIVEGLRFGSRPAPHWGMRQTARAFSVDRLLPLYAAMIESTEPQFDVSGAMAKGRAAGNF
jgi:colanic acid biosynthesis glycosyl transferase WcaI